MFFHVLSICLCHHDSTLFQDKERAQSSLYLLSSLIMQVCTSDDACRYGRVTELFVYEKFGRVPVDSVEAGDICAACGIDDIQVEPSLHGCQV